ncbi:metalloprotease TIKI1-like [Centruroides sculpturatus]|uniref:metalloprotease TIKI1-like n=2 Tax=Centruroides TaxID=6875 RepID=UPI000C6D6E9B|nr:metalloprotease TIKI1-like [Centruroides sculpturatus]
MAIGLYASLLTFILSIMILLDEVSSKRFRRPSFCDNSKSEEYMSFLWMVKKDPPSYFFGTIHVPYTRVWDYIPENVKVAFESSDTIYFELDLIDPKTISTLSNCQMLPQGKNLVDVLPEDLYRRLKRHLDYVKGMLPSWMTADQRGRGLYADYLFNAITGNWERKRPIWVMLMVNSLTESDVKSRGIPVLDLYLAQEAERMNKGTGAVEKVEEQCVPLNGLDFTQVLFALNQTLYQQESIRSGDIQAFYTTDDLIKHYNCGDLNSVVFSQDSTQVPHLNSTTMTSQEVAVARNIDRYFREELIYKRNKRMGDRVVQLLNTYPDTSYFFAFGAGHFLGNDTILDFVKEAGYQVVHVPSTRKLRGSWKKYKKNRSSTPTKDAKQRIKHDSVILLKATRSPSLNSHPRFNDLWVRLDEYSTRSPRISPKSTKSQYAPEQSVWHGGAKQNFPSLHLLSLCITLLHSMTIITCNLLFT